MRRLMASLVIGTAGMALAGCGAGRSADARPTAECPVCRCNGDLGCLIVRVDDATPRVERGGMMHYFCSRECRDEFVRRPDKYAGR